MRAAVLRRSHVPAEGLEAQIAEAEALARRAADALDYVGVLALEFFATRDGPAVQRDGAARPQ